MGNRYEESGRIDQGGELALGDHTAVDMLELLVRPIEGEHAGIKVEQKQLPPICDRF